MTIKCEICGSSIHAVQVHLREHHPEVTLDSYKQQFPNAPLLSETAKAAIAARQQAAAAAAPAPEPAPLVAHHAALKAVTSAGTAPTGVVVGKATLRETFGLGELPAAKNARGQDIPVTTMSFPDIESRELVPEADNNHQWNVDDLKNALMALELNMPLYVWGHKGTGKTTDIEQIAARTGRPLLRVQHTINTEEAHIVGQYVIRNGSTHFEYGPLAMAMLHGWTYLADEYDFGLASVLSVYQPVLEGKPLIIKEAPANMRVVRPHPQFRFVATGNTNGAGDETGLYQGTSIQNAANYDRFGMTVKKAYMDKDTEVKAIMARCSVPQKEAEKLVNIATQVRELFDNGKISDTLSTRTLVNVANIGLRRSSMPIGFKLSFINKLNRVDSAAVEGVVQRIYG